MELKNVTIAVAFFTFYRTIQSLHFAVFPFVQALVKLIKVTILTHC